MNDDISLLINEVDSFDRFNKIRDYLDQCDENSVDQNILESLINDQSEIIRAEVADFALIFGCISTEAIKNRLVKETSELVYPRLWLALALSDKSTANSFLNKLNEDNLSSFEKCYLFAALYVSSTNAGYLYKLCASAFSSDIAAAHSTIDLLQIVARQRIELLRELRHDLQLQRADNADKALAVFGDGVDPTIST